MARGGKARSRRQRQRTFGVSAKIDDDADELNPHGNNQLAAMQARLKKKADAKAYAKSKLEAKIDAEDRSDGGTMDDVIQKLKGLIVLVEMMKEVKKFHSLVDEALEKQLVDSLFSTE